MHNGVLCSFYSKNLEMQQNYEILLNVGLYWIWLEPDLTGFRNSNPTRARARPGFRKNLFSDHRTICPMKLLSVAIKQQYCSVLPLLCQRLPVFDMICGTAMDYIFFVTPPLTLDRSSSINGQAPVSQAQLTGRAEFTRGCYNYSWH